jgi:4-O-beta-D-mannosyl-D-glucose phosphorylase
MTIHPLYGREKRRQDRLIARPNPIDRTWRDGILDRHVRPVLTADHVPLTWRYDLSAESNPFFIERLGVNADPFFIERLGVNAVFNAGAIFHEGAYWLVARVEGKDRKSFFAVARSENGVSGFRFVGKPLVWNDVSPMETNVYDMRLTKHEDGWIYGIYCSESHDPAAPVGDTSAAIAAAGIVRTRDLISFERLPDLVTPSPQQRNVVLHPAFVGGRYLLYTRPQDGFIETGSGGGIAAGFCDDMTRAVIKEEILLDARTYHTVYEVKNGAGPAPIRTPDGWIHIAHGVRNTAAGLRYVLYAFATALDDPLKVVAKPSGYLLAPQGEEREGDVPNVLFCNGAVKNDRDEIFLYYASADTRLHVATTDVARLSDYVFRNPSDPLRSLACAGQRRSLAEANDILLEGVEKR